MTIRWGRVLRLSSFALLLLGIGVDVVLAWIYVGALIYPGCGAVPRFPEEFPAPQALELKTEAGLLVPAWYFPARNRAAILVLGGLGGTVGTPIPYIDPLLEAGYGVLQIGSRACATPVRPVTLGGAEVKDAAAGLAFLLTRGEVDPARIGIYGFSMGGVGAIRSAARYPEISAVLAEGGYFNLGQDMVEADEPFFRKVFLYTVAGVFWARTGINPWEISPVDEIGCISPRPVLLIYGEDELASGRGQLQFEAAREPKELWIVPGGDHGQNYAVAPEEYVRRLMAFFDETVGK